MAKHDIPKKIVQSNSLRGVKKLSKIKNVNLLRYILLGRILKGKQ